MLLYEKKFNQIKLYTLTTKCLNCFALNSVIYVVLFQYSERVFFFCNFTYSFVSVSIEEISVLKLLYVAIDFSYIASFFHIIHFCFCAA